MRAPKIFFIGDSKDYTNKLLLADTRKRVKGFLRLGCDTQVFAYNIAFEQLGALASKSLAKLFFKKKVDRLLCQQIRNYAPDIIYVNFATSLNSETIKMMRDTAPKALFLGVDVDIFPEMQKGRVKAAKELDVLLTTHWGKSIKPYTDAGVKCIFMPNICDPDIEYRYDVTDQWHSDILFTGKLVHKHYPTDDIRPKILDGLANWDKVALYGTAGKNMIWGMEYLYAISGTKIGLSINADNDISMYHSDRLTHYLSCGTCALAKRVPDSDRLFENEKHLRYFDTAEEFFDLAKHFLKNEDERRRIADAGMKRVHEEFNCEKIAGYTLDIVEKGLYKAPWNT